MALQDIDTYGDATAEHLKSAIDDSFMKSTVDGNTDCEKVHVNMPSEDYSKKLISATADGAAVNTGIYNGLLTRLEKDSRLKRPWLVKIHCVSHRLELSYKDSLLKDKNLSDIKDFMTTMYYVFKRSGKFKRHFKATAAALGVTVYNFPKVHGTRFLTHHRRGVSNLIHNWVVLAMTIENSISNSKFGNLQAKLRGILKKLQTFKFFATCCTYKNILCVLSKPAFKFELEKLYVFDVLLIIEQAKNELQDMIETKLEEVANMTSPNESDKCKISMEGTTLKFTMLKQ